MTTKVNVIVGNAEPLLLDLEKSPAIGERLRMTKEGKPYHLEIEKIEHQIEVGKEKAIVLYCKEIMSAASFDLFALT